MIRLFLLLGLLVGAVNAAPPNVLFIFSDDQRADTIGAHGNPLIKTPALDELAKNGTSFRRAYCLGSNNGAVCVPSRAMLMSGRPYFGLKDNLEGVQTWPEQFAEAGYATFITGKWHNGRESVVRCFQNGRSVFLGGMTDPNHAKVIDITNHSAGEPRQVAKHCVAAFADEAVEFLTKAAKDRPFLCYVSMNAPHDPCIVPDDFPIRYDPATMPLPTNFLPQHPFDQGDAGVRDEKLLPFPRTEVAVREKLADYYRAISYMDAQIARILAALKENGHADNTIVVFTSDHGLANGSHGLLGKQNLYEHSMGTPLIIGGPGLPKNQTSDALCYLLDLFPTLGELCGVRGPAASTGLSLVPVLKGQKKTHRPYIFTAYRGFARAIRDEHFKLIRYPNIDKTQLFDLATDPDEMNDLAADPKSGPEIGRLMNLLAEAQAAFGDKRPLTGADEVEKPTPKAQ